MVYSMGSVFGVTVRLTAVLSLSLAGSGIALGAPELVDPNGFHLEGKPAVDDVFGDSSDYRRIIDRFLELTTGMQATRDEFAKSTQAALAELGRNPNGELDGKQHVKKGHCPIDEVAVPYMRARKSGAEYLRLGHELARHYDQVKEFDRLGESVGLTPDYRWKVKRVLQQYNTLLTDYREMKVAFHDQLVDELHYAGCDLPSLMVRAEALPKTTPTTVASGSDEWPQPGSPGAPGVPAKPGEKPPDGGVAHESLPPTLPVEHVPPREAIALPSRKTPMPADEKAQSQPRSGILFYVDNAKCQRPSTVYLDGKKLGEVPAGARVGYQTAPGPHDLCLIADPQKECGSPGTLRRSYLHEGWTISLRCE